MRYPRSLLFSCVGLACAGLAWPAAASGAEWWYVGKSSSSAMYIDSESLKRSGAEVTGWSYAVYAQPLSAGQKEAKAQRSWDCAAKTEKYLYLVLVKPGGEVMVNGPVTEQAVPVVPDTLGDALLKFVCGDRGSARRIAPSLPSDDSKSVL